MQSVFDSYVAAWCWRLFEDMWGGLSAELHHRPVWKPCVPYHGLRIVGCGTMGVLVRECPNVRGWEGACMYNGEGVMAEFEGWCLGYAMRFSYVLLVRRDIASLMLRKVDIVVAALDRAA